MLTTPWLYLTVGTCLFVAALALAAHAHHLNRATRARNLVDDTTGRLDQLVDDIAAVRLTSDDHLVVQLPAHAHDDHVDAIGRALAHALGERRHSVVIVGGGATVGALGATEARRLRDRLDFVPPATEEPPR